MIVYPGIDISQPFRYVDYDENGTLLGCYIQLLQPEHENAYFPVDDSYIWTWTNYRMNEDRDGLELTPPVEPEDPPVDPEPEEPVQSGN